MGRSALVVALVAAALAIGYLVGNDGDDDSTTVIKITTDKPESRREELRETIRPPGLSPRPV